MATSDGDNALDDIPDDDLETAASVIQRLVDAGEIDPDSPTGRVSRRNVLAGAGALGAGALLGGAGSTHLVGEADAGSQQSGTTGTASNPVDVEAEDINAASSVIGELNNVVDATRYGTTASDIQTAADEVNGGSGVLWFPPGEYTGLSSKVDIYGGQQSNTDRGGVEIWAYGATIGADSTANYPLRFTGGQVRMYGGQIIGGIEMAAGAGLTYGMKRPTVANAKIWTPGTHEAGAKLHEVSHNLGTASFDNVWVQFGDRPNGTDADNNYGIWAYFDNDNVTDVTIHDCVVSGYSEGIRMSGTSAISIADSHVFANQTGIYAGGTTIWIRDCYVENNGGFGVLFSPGNEGFLKDSYFVHNGQGNNYGNNAGADDDHVHADGSTKVSMNNNYFIGEAKNSTNTDRAVTFVNSPSNCHVRENFINGTYAGATTVGETIASEDATGGFTTSGNHGSV